MENKELNRLPLYFFNLKGLHLCGGFSSLAVSRDFFFFLTPFITFAVSPPTDICWWITDLLQCLQLLSSPCGACGFLPGAAVAWLQLPTQACNQFHREGRSWGEDEQGNFCALFCRTAAAEPPGSAQPPQLAPRAGYVCTDDQGKQKESPARCVLKTLWPVPGVIPDEQSPACKSAGVLKLRGRGWSSRNRNKTGIWKLVHVQAHPGPYLSREQNCSTGQSHLKFLLLEGGSSLSQFLMRISTRAFSTSV